MPLKLDKTNWMLGLINLEVYNSVFNVTRKIIDLNYVKVLRMNVIVIP